MHCRQMLLAVFLMLVIAACERGAPTSPSSIASSGLVIEPVAGLAGPSGGTTSI